MRTRPAARSTHTIVGECAALHVTRHSAGSSRLMWILLQPGCWNTFPAVHPLAY
jgi:hypothetical protein